MNHACIACQRLNMRANPEFAALGYGRCGAQSVATFVHIMRNLPCEKFRQQDEAGIEARRVWWAARCEKEKLS